MSYETEQFSIEDNLTDRQPEVPASSAPASGSDGTVGAGLLDASADAPQFGSLSGLDYGEDRTFISGDTGVVAGSSQSLSPNLLSVSGGDIYGLSYQSDQEAQTEILVTIEERLEHIEESFLLLNGMLLFFWCFARIRNAVRSFVGKNIE